MQIFKGDDGLFCLLSPLILSKNGEDFAFDDADFAAKLNLKIFDKVSNKCYHIIV